MTYEHEPKKFVSSHDLEARIKALELAVFAPKVDPEAVKQAKLDAVAQATKDKADELKAEADKAPAAEKTEAQKAADKAQAVAAKAQEKATA